MVHATKSKIHQITSHDQIAFNNQITPHGQTMLHQTIQPNMLPNMLPTMLSSFNPYNLFYQIYQSQILQPQISQPQIPQPQTITRYNISLNQFFSELDQIYNGKGAYIALEKLFEEQEIIVNSIKELKDDQLIELGVTKVRWRINIKQEA
ncbi:7501_t:CDS:1, partial [Scutellospora calospora]